MYDIFQIRKINNNLTSPTVFASNCVNTNKFGLKPLRYFGSKVWSMVSLEIKNSESVKILKRKFEIESLKTVIVTCVRPVQII